MLERSPLLLSPQADFVDRQTSASAIHFDTPVPHVLDVQVDAPRLFHDVRGTRVLLGVVLAGIIGAGWTAGVSAGIGVMVMFGALGLPLSVPYVRIVRQRDRLRGQLTKKSNRVSVDTELLDCANFVVKPDDVLLLEGFLYEHWRKGTEFESEGWVQTPAYRLSLVDRRELGGDTVEDAWDRYVHVLQTQPRVDRSLAGPDRLPKARFLQSFTRLELSSRVAAALSDWLSVPVVDATRSRRRLVQHIEPAPYHPNAQGSVSMPTGDGGSVSLPDDENARLHPTPERIPLVFGQPTSHPRPFWIRVRDRADGTRIYRIPRVRPRHIVAAAVLFLATMVAWAALVLWSTAPSLQTAVLWCVGFGPAVFLGTAWWRGFTLEMSIDGITAPDGQTVHWKHIHDMARDRRGVRLRTEHEAYELPVPRIAVRWVHDEMLRWCQRAAWGARPTPEANDAAGF